MNRLSIIGLGSLLGVALLEGCSCNGPRVAHSGDNPIYPLLGLHQTVPCEACHGSGTPKAVSRLCIDCHDADRPDPGHNPGQDCGNCHNELPPAWLNTPTGPTGPTGETGTIIPTGFTGDTGTIIEPDPIHDNLDSNSLCWDCHEVDRKDPEHYANPANAQRNWDCGSCHPTSPDTGPENEAWGRDFIIHPTRTPHGTYYKNAAVPVDSGRWVVACEYCHQDLNDYSQFECSSCHNGLGALPAQLDIWANGQHFDAIEPGPASDALCEDCHTYGDLEDLTP